MTDLPEILEPKGRSFEKLVLLAQDAKRLHDEGKLEACSNALCSLFGFIHRLDNQVMIERTDATYEATLNPPERTNDKY